MKLLVVTQKADKNDQNLGFFHEWIVELARHFEAVTVICLEEGAHRFPAHVRVMSLGKESRRSRWQYISRFFSYIWSMRREYDAVFVHMNPEYAVLGGIVWKILRKPITLWYTHKSVDLKLRVAARCADKVFTASPESFRLKSRKTVVTGHGIDTEAFSPAPDRAAAQSVVRDLISVARISATKNQLVMVEAMDRLSVKGFEGKLIIVGDAVRPDDRRYLERIKSYISEHRLEDRAVMIGGVPHEDLSELYRSAAIAINLSTTGSVDKAVLEAMACGIKVITSNEAFKGVLPARCMTDGSPEDLARKVMSASDVPDSTVLRDYVVENHSLAALGRKLALEIQDLKR